MENEVHDFASRIKKYYYSKALLCESLIDGKVDVQTKSLQMPPDDYNPSKDSYVEAYILGCAAIDGLSSMYQGLQVSNKQIKENQKRFVSFLLHLNINKYLERVSTPFLYYSLKKKEKQKIEEPFREEIKNVYINVNDKWEGEFHRVYSDPKIDELKLLYNNCHTKQPILLNKTIKDIDSTLSSFTYAALIYKFYRCPFIHEFRASQYATFFNNGNQISVREFKSTKLYSGEDKPIKDVKPQLDVGINLFAESIRKGADIIYDLIIKTKCTDIPYSSTDEINIKTN